MAHDQAEHARLSAVVTEIRSDCERSEARAAATAAALVEIRDTLTRLRFAAWLIVAFLGVGAAGASWVVEHAVTDALVKHGLIQIGPKVATEVRR